MQTRDMADDLELLPQKQDENIASPTVDVREQSQQQGKEAALGQKYFAKTILRLVILLVIFVTLSVIFMTLYFSRPTRGAKCPLCGYQRFPSKTSRRVLLPALCADLLTMTDVSPRQLNLRWKAPHDPDGIIKGYYVTWRMIRNDKNEKMEGELKEKFVKCTSGMFVEITNLQPFSLYNISVTAAIGAQNGSTTYKMHRTSEAVPGPPTMMNLIDISSIQLDLSWAPPSDPNGIIKGYYVRWKMQRDNKNKEVYAKGEKRLINGSSATFVELKYLEPFSLYYVSVTAFTDAGDGPPAYNRHRTSRVDIYSSCSEVLQKNSAAKDEVYTIRTNITAGYSKVYCQMTSLAGCSGGGWTLVMKTDGKKETFRYSSSYWTNKEPYSTSGGLTGFDDIETKLPTYWSTSFNQLCVGFKVGNDLRFTSINYTASSLYSLIADGQYRPTNIGRQKWKSLINGSSLQVNCEKEGFNIFGTLAGAEKARLGIISNNQFHCRTPDSYIGFGGIPTFSRHDFCEGLTNAPTCGNVAHCSHLDNGVKKIAAIGYILVR